MKADTPIPPELRAAYAEMIQADRIRNARVACILVVVLMPLGYLMDAFVYPLQAGYLFQMRLMTSAGAALFWMALRVPVWKAWQYRILCAGWYLVPAFFISWMIHSTDGASSTYYAGLNLVILAVSSVIQATVLESLVAIGLICAMYLVACFTTSTAIDWRIFINNATFIFYTIAIVITGNYFYNRLRYSEFALRYELDQNRRQLEESNQKLLELGQVKDRFFANISHELRTPLTLLISPLEILLFQPGSELRSEQKSLAQTMHANAMRLLKMINDLLDLVRLESGRMEVKREPIEIGEFARSLHAATRQVALEKQLTLNATAAPDLSSILADRDKLEKICLNLLFNAIKFTPVGGKVEFAAGRRDDQLVFTVRDTGVGISEKNLPFVFDRFWQADNSSKRKFKGVGIGLSLVKELTEVQGGSVSVESEEGKGTTFTVRIPYVAADAAASLAQATAETEKKTGPSAHSEEWLTNLYRRAELFSVPDSEGAARANGAAGAGAVSVIGRPQTTVVIADDEPGMVRFIRSQIERRYHVIEAVNGREALDRVSQHLPDIVLLDMNMPEMDGLQVCRELRANPATEKIPIILLTARADEETKLAALTAGANDFLPKPFSVAELHVRIRNLVQSHDYQQELNRQNQTLARTIEQLKETETQLVQTAKMASLGRMSAGIIHEINNPLNFATTGLYTLRNKGRHLPSAEQGEYSEIVRDIEDGLKRVRNIVTDLRTFTHPDSGQVGEVDVSEVVASALRFLSNEWRGKVQIDVNLPESQSVRANKERLVQVLLNLLQNSLDALKNRPSGSEPPIIRINGRVTADKSVLVVRDNGEGIATENLDKIFDPFFTTKDVGEGMGLGLSICYRLVREAGGHISVRSERGRFTEFALEFPARKAESVAAESGR